MKLDRKKCRPYAAQALKAPKNSGLLHAEQIEYIIRTAVRVINHHKVLVLYVYPREKAAEGDLLPKFTVFQGRDDFVTLDRREDGTTAWRVSAFDNLGGLWRFSQKCAFYALEDEEKIQKFFGEKEIKGLYSLAMAQYKIQQRKQKERQRLKERRIVERMEALPPLPRTLKKWVHCSIMPAYFFYDYKKSGKTVKGICTSCGKEVEVARQCHLVKIFCVKLRDNSGYFGLIVLLHRLLPI
ncbi:MAG: hypothetical protein NC331_08335 [Lachnospiraceae bacterium]|nr:hypothetical protein [Lachnospiraceae bacterium]MCM1239379.1 hypothetical protein [Lachnospiraceae bacterium]